ncbi:PLP-dependent aminotransferase family protein [Emticicia sp. BO119]|uniref:aminotransferase-like domain-containing protein n=1 Tax=Emticicia sp. BO119 TaxID=2757768 RepID=UPI0015F07678|nr:PLP-dependent aminotransferase family protein [Emticicia sp. BO119]MBA4850852.1 PLP-dependent aminotransferase family protein [Emticicia sp. BO119]
MKIPFKSLISFDKNSSIPLYIQITNAIIKNIQAGILQTNTKLPGTRELAELLDVHRKTVIAAYDELLSQNWVEVIPQKGTFIATRLPIIKPSILIENISKEDWRNKLKKRINDNSAIYLPPHIQQKLAFNDGLPDVRLAPRHEWARLQSHYIRYADPMSVGYTDPQGSIRFRTLFAKYLNETRGIQATPKHIITTRGSQMGIYLAGMAILQKGDTAIVGELSYRAANLTFMQLGAELITIPVDEDGLQTDVIEDICKHKKVKMIYITSHHYHPTTVTLKPERRLRLLALAEKYQFFILEDDYDYDYHYANTPILPLASADRHGWVIYVGSFSKQIAPTFRVGYVTAHESIIEEMTKIRRIIDRQNDTILEYCLADMLENGDLKRYATKAIKVYKERRDFTCLILKDALGDKIDFKIPDGGMAIWVNYDTSIPLQSLSEKVAKQGLYLANGQTYKEENPTLNACRMGFASMNQKETEDAVRILKKAI